MMKQELESNRFTIVMNRICLTAFLFMNAFQASTANATTASSRHEGPDPIAHWLFDATSVGENKLAARLGPDLTIGKGVTITGEGPNQAAHFDGTTTSFAAKNFRDLNESLIPQEHFTVSTWVSIEEPKKWGGIVGMLQDNGGFEKGWTVGYNETRFYFGLATAGSADSDGYMTYLTSDTRYEPGKLYHVAAVYDGETMQIYVNGKLDGESKDQKGKILYPDHAPFVIGAYHDDDENVPHKGLIREVAIYDLAAKPEWVAKEFSHQAALTKLPPQNVEPIELEFVITPYLQFVTQNSITVMCETSRPVNVILRHGETAAVSTEIKGEQAKYLHEMKIDSLQPETQYFYQVEATDDQGKTIKSDVRTFQTANRAETPFGFAIISDTQSNPEVSGKIAELVWAQRPNFLLHPGDLVGTGTTDTHWTKQFFPSMSPLISRVAFFPVLGNHEVNAKNYYNYMSLPTPEYFYKFTYGNTEFFMVDTNKKVDSDSEQYKWLDAELAKSNATWKIVCHHHPAYSSDENDYGNLWKTNKSTKGDLRVRELTVLYDKHNVDIVWSGHIHSYERTWAIKNQKVVAEGAGPIYMITGGGGGSLETAGPTKPFFQNNVRHGHHYCMVSINGGTLEFKAFDLENRLFDYLKLSK